MNPNIPPEAEELKNKLLSIAALEQEIAPKGVNFAVRGQEDPTSFKAVESLQNPIAAADAVLSALLRAKDRLANIDALRSEAVAL